MLEPLYVLFRVCPVVQTTQHNRDAYCMVDPLVGLSLDSESRFQVCLRHRYVRWAIPLLVAVLPPLAKTDTRLGES